MSPYKKKTDPVEERRSRLNAAREAPGSPASIEILRKGLADKVQVVVSRAADLVGELELASLAPEMTAAFERFLLDPSKDKGCLAKTAIMEVLVKLEHDDSEVFRKGIRHVQREPVWGGTEDTAAWLRGLSAIGLAGSRAHERDVLNQLVDALADPEKLARVGAARALGRHGRAEGALLLRSKLLQGDSELEVISECFHSLMALEPPGEACAFVARFLESADPAIVEGAALALGESRLSTAFPILRKAWDEAFDRSSKRVLLIAVALLRSDEATDFLLSLISRGSEESARSAVSALGPFLYVEELRRKTRDAVTANGDEKLLERYEEELRKITIPPA